MCTKSSTLTSSIFQIEKLNARVPDPNNSAFNVLGGDQRVRGFEVGVAGSITDNWQIYAGYAYLNSKVIKSSVAASIGVPLANTPQNTFSLWTTYLLPWYSVQLGGGVQYVDRRLASTTPNTTTRLLEYAPGYTTRAADGESADPARSGCATKCLQSDQHQLFRPAASEPCRARRRTVRPAQPEFQAVNDVDRCSWRLSRASNSANVALHLPPPTGWMAAAPPGIRRRR